MKIFKSNEDGWYCGWWNNSPLQINYANRDTLYKNEAYHFHEDFHEYYLVISGYLILKVEDKLIKLTAGESLMIDPQEKHMVREVPKEGCKYISIKSKSYPNNKIFAEAKPIKTTSDSYN